MKEEVRIELAGRVTEILEEIQNLIGELLPYLQAEQKGYATHYGCPEDAGKLNKHTANGDVFDPRGMTCASWFFGFGTMLKVTNTLNGKSVIVKVNDRGPNWRLVRGEDKIIDLTYGAFSKLARPDEGVIPVIVDKVRDK